MTASDESSKLRDDEKERRGGKRPRRSTQAVKYIYSDDSDKDDDDTGSLESLEIESGSDDLDSDDLDDTIVDKDDLSGEKPSKRQKRGKKIFPVNSEGSKTFQCPHCGKTFKTQSGLQYHLDNLVCREKDRNHTKKEMKRPPKKKARKSVEKEKNRTCPHCKRVFKSILGLKYHVGK